MGTYGVTMARRKNIVPERTQHETDHVGAVDNNWV